MKTSFDESSRKDALLVFPNKNRDVTLAFSVERDHSANMSFAAYLRLHCNKVGVALA